MQTPTTIIKQSCKTDHREREEDFKEGLTRAMQMARHHKHCDSAVYQPATIKEMIQKNIRLFGTPKYIWDQVMNSRATLHMSIPAYETHQIQILKDSFIPRTIRSWNALDEDTRKTPPSSFSCVLKKKLMSLQG